MRAVLFTPIAESEADEAEEWYDRASSGLGKRFRVALDAAVSRLADSPEQFPGVLGDVRRARLSNPFPYSLFFKIRPRGVLVIACSHDRRDPARWQRRS